MVGDLDEPQLRTEHAKFRTYAEANNLFTLGDVFKILQSHMGEDLGLLLMRRLLINVVVNCPKDTSRPCSANPSHRKWLATWTNLSFAPNAPS